MIEICWFHRRGLIEEKLGMQINLVSPKDKNQAFEDPEDRSLVTAKVVQNRPTKLVFEVRNTSGTFHRRTWSNIREGGEVSFPEGHTVVYLPYPIHLGEKNHIKTHSNVISLQSEVPKGASIL